MNSQRKMTTFIKYSFSVYRKTKYGNKVQKLKKKKKFILPRLPTSYLFSKIIPLFTCHPDQE